MERQKVSKFIILPAIIFVFAFALRRYFFGGFISGDDAQEFPLLLHIMKYGPDFRDQLFQRFGTWMFNYASFKMFGVSETAFFLPTLIMSSSFSVIGYFLFVHWGHKPWHAFTASLFIASAPFEVLVGSIRANDVILGWFLALGFLFLIIYEKKPFLQGLALAFFLWLAFYVKLWVVYLFPALGIYYLVQVYRTKIWRGLFSLCFFSVLFHAITSFFWKFETGSFFPFITNPAATYPIPAFNLYFLFIMYPKMLFTGSEFWTTLFGPIPYLLMVFILLKAISTAFYKSTFNRFKLDKIDLYLSVYYISFFIFLNFFPNAFKFDQYYSMQRIFRYLTPISFPMTLHLAKLILDFCLFAFAQGSQAGIRLAVPLFVLIPLLAVNIFYADNATTQGQEYRKALLSIVRDVKEQSPPRLLSESWLGCFLEGIYLKEEQDRTRILLNIRIYGAGEYEKWLQDDQVALPAGTMLITGLGNYIYSGCHVCGFRLRHFKNNLNPGWKLFKGYNMLNYLPYPEPARLWIWAPNDKQVNSIIISKTLKV